MSAAARAAAIVTAGFTPSVSSMRLAVAVEESRLQLAAVTPPNHRDVVAFEVRRRRDDLGMSELASVQSVSEDLVTGRWQL